MFQELNANLNEVSKTLYERSNIVCQNNQGLTLAILESLNQNNAATQYAQQTNYNSVQNSINHLNNSANEQIEKNRNESNLTTLTTANSVRASVQDSTTILNTNISDVRKTINNDLSILASSIERNSNESKKVTYKQNLITRQQADQNLDSIKNDIHESADKQIISQQLSFTNVSNLILETSHNQAIAQKDIQKQALENSYTQQLFATQNANTNKLDTLKSTEQLAHRLQETELEALKRKEQLSQQILQSELNIIRSENVIISALKKQTCKIKEQIDARAIRTQRLLKSGETSRLKDDLLEAQITTHPHKQRQHEHVCADT